MIIQFLVCEERFQEGERGREVQLPRVCGGRSDGVLQQQGQQGGLQVSEASVLFAVTELVVIKSGYLIWA